MGKSNASQYANFGSLRNIISLGVDFAYYTVKAVQSLSGIIS